MSKRKKRTTNQGFDYAKFEKVAIEGLQKAQGIKNRRNGHTSKAIQTTVGNIQIHSPRDRTGNFSPQLVEKWE